MQQLEKNDKLSWLSKISFGMGAFGKDLVYALVGNLFMFYLTDVRFVAPTFVGTLFMIARIWDAFNDPFMGMVVDNTRSKWGKFRPWIMIGTVLNAVVSQRSSAGAGLSSSPASFRSPDLYCYSPQESLRLRAPRPWARALPSSTTALVSCWYLLRSCWLTW